MKKTLLFLLAGVAASGAYAQVNLPYQEIPYDVNYRWGLVDVNIAHGRVTLYTEGDRFVATLDGSSIPWEGRIFCISDQLNARMEPSNGLSREVVTYENGWYRKPRVAEYRSGEYNPNDPANFKNIKGEGSLDADAATMEAVNVTADMLGMFYYFHEINFDAMSPGTFTIPITVEGGYDQRVSVTYNGKSTYTVGGVTYPTYSVSFEYSYHGAMSGYPVEAQVSASSRIPLLLSADLPVGHIEMIHHPE
ncbi:MAG: DUF3108 domain-containing protein [Muribaculaceae bacterium]|nr:DUF3108 domain-containing protein [Muribaculaceae bacterium]